jgi:N-acylneuraminate cytidylyltransferase
VLQHALTWLAENAQEHYDFVCLLQPTSPFRPAGFIDRAIQKLLGSGADSLVSVLPVPTEYNPHWVFEPDAGGLLRIATGETQIIPRRQSLPAAYFRDGALYLSKTAVILQENSLFGKQITYLESDPVYHCNIDSMDDWQQAEKMVERLCAG